MPATKSLRSGTCASTLLPMMRSACWPSADQLCGEPHAEEVDQRRDALVDRATSATLAAGSMPSTGTPSGRKCCSR